MIDWKTLSISREPSLVPRLPHFYLRFTSIIIHRIGRQGELKQGRPGNIYHVSGCKMDVGGKGLIFIYIHTKLENEFLNGQGG